MKEDNYEELLNLKDHVGISNINNISELSFEETECLMLVIQKMIKRTTSLDIPFDTCYRNG